MATLVSVLLLFSCMYFSNAVGGRLQRNHTRNFTVLEDSSPGTIVMVLQSSPSCLYTEGRSAKITTGDSHKRFRTAVSSNCQAALVVNNPLDRSIQARYDLVVSLNVKNVTYFFTEYIEVTVIVADVVDYPPLYNMACEIPVRRNTDAGQFLLSLSGRATLDSYSGEPLRFSHTALKPSSISELYIRTDSKNCLVLLGMGAHHYTDVGIAHNIYANGFRSTTCTQPGYSDVSIEVRLIAKPEQFQPDPHWVNEDHRLPVDVTPDVVAAWNAKPKSQYFLFLYIPLSITPGPINLTCDLGDLNTHKQFGLGLSVSSVTLELETLGCEEGKFGPLCDQDCICKNGACCHGLNGACKCTLGWQGVACDIPKPTVAITISSKYPGNVAYIGGAVSLSCMTFHLNVSQVRWEFKPFFNRRNKTNIWANTNNTLINMGPVFTNNNGHYTCTVVTEKEKTFQDSFSLNATECPPNRRGDHCNETCNCLQGAACDRRTGCDCPSGWEGEHCELMCPDGTYGKGCIHKCDCENTATKCHHVTGQCVCLGRIGINCEDPCPEGKYGPRCEKNCECRSNASCDVMTGRCLCGQELAGEFCDVKKSGVDVTVRNVVISVTISATFFTVCLARQTFWQRLYRAVTGNDKFEDDELVTDDVEQRLLRWEKDPGMMDLAEMVGQGKFGHVLRGKLRNPDGSVTQVAAKTVHQNDSQAHRAFCHEMAILITIQEGLGVPARCSNIVELRGIITQSEPKYILLEFAERGDLLSALRQSRNIDAHQTNFWRLGVDVARALLYLQELKLVHRDVAARNVLISASGVGKLADFGLSRDIYTDSVYTHTHTDNLGQLNHLPLKWMALESLRDGEFTHKSDVWAYGVLLWEIATMGHEPVYPGPHRPDCHHLINVLEEGHRLQIPRGCSLDMYRLMMRCWNVDLDRRPEPEDLIETVQLCGNVQIEYVEIETTV
ncbi:uncharacterized protein [Branchiostoma lanceolatum]|uniref:uncharacterized protein n=1 Tax=Branchiostoma lanceolatum TaxID=7740 RepID=UPI0034532529